MATYPIQFGQVFKQGDAQSPVCALNDVAIPTQVNVLTRWGDNSVKHAVFTIVLTGNINDLLTLQFKEGTPLGTTPGSLISLTASIKISDKPAVLLSELSPTPYITGPLCSTYVYVDHTGAHDILSTSGSKMRPIFHVQHWHTVANAKVRFIGEICQINAMAECNVGDTAQPLILQIDGVTRYTMAGVQWQQQMMSHASRWTRVFWKAAAPSEPQIFKHDVGYLADSGASFNFDSSIVVTEAAIASMYGQWAGVVGGGNAELFKAGLWNKAMGSGGASDFVGPWTTWNMLLLYSGDKRMRELCEGQANLGCQFPMHYRELDGSLYSVENHPQCQLLNLQSNAARSGVTIVGSGLDSWGWNPDTSHQPGFYFGLYLLTADVFHYEQAAFWASWSCAFYNHQATTSHNGCGPTGAEGGIPGINSVTIRGQAWVFRSRCEVAAFAPDSRVAEKAYFNRMVQDAIEIWEGERNITSTVNFNSPNWSWGRLRNPQDHPLRMWERGNGAFVQDDVDPRVTGAAISTWEQNFLVIALGRGLELGYATDALMNWIAPVIQGQQNNMGYGIANNRLATANLANADFTTWEQMLTTITADWEDQDWYRWPDTSYHNTTTAGAVLVHSAEYGTNNMQGRFNAKLSDLNHGYTNIALAAAKMLNAASPFMLTNAVPNFTTNPKWAIITRSSQPVPPEPPEPPGVGQIGQQWGPGAVIGPGGVIGGV
jgi:hypothetical protein